MVLKVIVILFSCNSTGSNLQVTEHRINLTFCLPRNKKEEKQIERWKQCPFAAKNSCVTHRDGNGSKPIGFCHPKPKPMKNI